MGIFSQTISVWAGVNRSAENRYEMNIADFLNLGVSYLPTIKWLRQWYDYGLAIYSTNPQESMRAFDVYKQTKEQMPLATIGGNYANTGLSKNLIATTKLMCLDIDTTKPHKAAKLAAQGKVIPNAHVKDWQRVKRQLSHLPWVAYCGLSIGGHGLFLIVPIDDHSKYVDRWMAAEYLLRKFYGLTVDPQTKDATRPRFISYDDSPYINENADIFSVSLPKQQQRPPMRHVAPATQTSDAETIARFVDYIEAHRIDITTNYGGQKGKSGKGWADLPPALFQVFGDAGEDFFHRLSQFHPEYNVTAATKKWHENKRRSQIGIGTFFMLCKDYGITIEKVLGDNNSGQRQQLRPTKKTTAPLLGATPSPAKVRYSAIPLFPKTYSSISVYEDYDLPEDFFTERAGAVPF